LRREHSHLAFPQIPACHVLFDFLHKWMLPWFSRHRDVWLELAIEILELGSFTLECSIFKDIATCICVKLLETMWCHAQNFHRHVDGRKKSLWRVHLALASFMALGCKSKWTFHITTKPHSLRIRFLWQRNFSNISKKQISKKIKNNRWTNLADKTASAYWNDRSNCVFKARLLYSLIAISEGQTTTKPVYDHYDHSWIIKNESFGPSVDAWPTKSDAMVCL